jgi:hypothetical protein
MSTTLQHAKHKIARRAANRLSTETLLHYAQFLPELPRALLTAHHHLGMNTRQLSLLHHTSERHMRQRLARLRSTLADPCFLLVAQFGSHLPPDLAALAHAFWIEGLTLHDLAQRRRETLHRTRLNVALARSLLLIHVSCRHPITGDEACAALRHQLRRA